MGRAGEPSTSTAEMVNGAKNRTKVNGAKNRKNVDVANSKRIGACVEMEGTWRGPIDMNGKKT